MKQILYGPAIKADNILAILLLFEFNLPMFTHLLTTLTSKCVHGKWVIVVWPNPLSTYGTRCRGPYVVPYATP